MSRDADANCWLFNRRKPFEMSWTPVSRRMSWTVSDTSDLPQSTFPVLCFFFLFVCLSDKQLCTLQGLWTTIDPRTPNIGYGHESTEIKQLSLCHNTTLADLPQDNTTGTQRPQRTPGASPIRYLLTTNNKPPAAHISLHTHYKLLKECQHSNCLSWSKTGRVPNKKSCPKTHTHVTIWFSLSISDRCKWIDRKSKLSKLH